LGKHKRSKSRGKNHNTHDDLCLRGMMELFWLRKSNRTENKKKEKDEW
jgi:hypothetical protein